MHPDATVIITTKNRREELRRAVQSGVNQSGAAIEIIVIDDGSTDGTAEMIAADFPGIRLERSETSMGYIAQRNRGAGLATAPVIVSIDDDAAFSTPNVVAQTLADFDDARIGAVAIPFINVNDGPAVFQRAPDNNATYITDSYIGTAHALKREAFLHLTGYRAQLFHQCEEEDYAIRMLNQGLFVRAGRADPIHHFESPQRSKKRIFVFNARNHLLFGWQNVPMPWYPLHAAGTTVRLLQHGLRERHLGWTLQGLGLGVGACMRHIAERRAVTGRSYRLSRWLKKNGPTPLSEVVSRLH